MLSLVLLCLIMAIVTIAAGWVPLLFPQKLDTALLSQISAGVILGTTFLIVVPEGYEQVGDVNSIAGLAIVAGYLLMLLVNLVLKGTGSDNNSDEDLNFDVDSDSRESPINDQDSNAQNGSPSVSLYNVRSWMSQIGITTLGLTIHAAADGIALGATQGSESTKLKLLVFVSILIHKAPAAFSLTSILLAERPELSPTHIKRDLLLFSLAGPALAILLGGALSLFGSSGSGTASKLGTGICLAFSGGTFVFVAVHVIEQIRFRDLNPLLVITLGTIPPFIASLIPE